MEKLIALLMALVLCLPLCACGNNASEGIDQEISAATDESQGAEETSSMSEEVRTVQRKIDKALESDLSYEKLVEIQNLYEELLSDEQKQIKNYNSFKALLQLDRADVAAILSINKLKELLENPSTLELLAVDCVTARYVDCMMVKINYTAANEYGIRSDATSYFTVDIPTYNYMSKVWSCKLEDSFNRLWTFYDDDSYVLAGFGFLQTKTKNDAQKEAKQSYDREVSSGGDFVSLDPVKLLYNIDLNIQN